MLQGKDKPLICGSGCIEEIPGGWSSVQNCSDPKRSTLIRCNITLCWLLHPLFQIQFCEIFFKLPKIPPHASIETFFSMLFWLLSILNLNKPGLGLLLHGDRDDLGFCPWQDTAGQLTKHTWLIDTRWRKGICNTPVLSLLLSDEWTPGLDSPSGGLRWRSHQKFKKSTKMNSMEKMTV